jgi:hypothetical protein
LVVNKNGFLVFGITGATIGFALIMEGLLNIRMYFNLAVGILKWVVKKFLGLQK